MSPRTKRSLDGSQTESSTSKHARKDPMDTIRCVPLENAPMITTNMVQYYTQMYGQNLFMDKGDRYIDVKFVDFASARSVRLQLHKLNPPFTIKSTFSINLADIRVKSPGQVTMYQAPRDRGHYDEQPYLPHGCTNPFPIQFKIPPRDPAKQLLPPRLPARPPRVKPIYPELAQPVPPSPLPPFVQPRWPHQESSEP